MMPGKKKDPPAERLELAVKGSPSRFSVTDEDVPSSSSASEQNVCAPPPGLEHVIPTPNVPPGFEPLAPSAEPTTSSEPFPSSPFPKPEQPPPTPQDEPLDDLVFAEPEGFGTEQYWEPPVMDLPEEQSPTKSYDEDFPTLSKSPVKGAEAREKKGTKEKVEVGPKEAESGMQGRQKDNRNKRLPEKQIYQPSHHSQAPRVLQRRKITWENVEIPRFLFDTSSPSYVAEYAQFYETGRVQEVSLDDGVKIAFSGCRNQDLLFCTLTKPLRNMCVSVTATFALRTSEGDIREIIKELFDDWESKVSMEQESGDRREKISQKSLKVLEMLHIKPLETKVVNFPEAIYYCELCDYHINNMAHFRNHIDEGPHMAAQQIVNERRRLVIEMPRPSKNHMAALLAMINRVSPVDMPNLVEQAQHVGQLIRDRFARIEALQGRFLFLELMGSVYYGVYNADSDINFTFDIKDISLSDIYDVMKSIETDLTGEEKPFEEFSEITVSHGTHPRITMLYQSKLRIMMTWRMADKVALAKRLKKYADLNPKIPMLMRAVRHWAKTCDLLPPFGLQKHGFDLMLLYSLQQHRKIPVITDDEQEFPPQDFDAVEELIAFFGLYAMKFDKVVQIDQLKLLYRRETKWNNKLFQIKHPFRDDNVVTFNRHYQPYFLNCFVASFIYFTVPRDIRGPVVDIQTFSPEANEREQKRQKEYTKRLERLERAQTGKESDQDETPVKCGEVVEMKRKRIRNRAKMTYDTKTNVDFPQLSVNGVRVSQLRPNDVELDAPGTYSRQACCRILRSMEELESEGLKMKEDVPEDVLRILKRPTFKGAAGQSYTERYFGGGEKQTATVVAQESRSEVIDDGLSDKEEHINFVMAEGVEKKEEGEGSEVKRQVAEITAAAGDITLETTVEDETRPSQGEFVLPELRNRQQMDEEEISESDRPPETPGTPSKKVSLDEFRINCKVWPLHEIFYKVTADWPLEQYDYSLDDPANFNRGFLPDIRCVHCESNKHMSQECPEMQLPEVKEITYRRDSAEWDHLEQMILDECERIKLSRETHDTISTAVANMQELLQDRFKGARLELFGSVKNGFGTANSDADICFRLESDTAPTDIDVEKTMNEIAQILKARYRRDIFIQPILQAKVPILKFQFFDVGRRKTIDGDISFYNTLALANTQMLHKYTEWDSRVATLGLWVKNWAKFCDIGDASRGSLSSYSYIIMVIHYLQNCSPPILPRLQEEFRTPDDLEEKHCDWDVYFDKTVRENWTSNQLTVSELFVGFLDYYAKFDYQNMVIQIRREKPLSKLEKCWNKPICLEDPFDLKHNLGAVVNIRMSIYIMKTIRRSREVFSNEIKFDGHNLRYQNVVRDVLKSCVPGKAPQSTRNCFFCGRIGHNAEGCPRKAEAEKLNGKFTPKSDRRPHGGGGGRGYRGGPRREDRGHGGDGPRDRDWERRRGRGQQLRQMW